MRPDAIFFSVFFFFPYSLFFFFLILHGDSKIEGECLGGRADDVHFGRLIKDKGGLGAKGQMVFVFKNKWEPQLLFYFLLAPENSVGISGQRKKKSEMAS